MSDKPILATVETAEKDEAVKTVQAGKPITLLAGLAKPQHVLSASNEQLTRISTNKPRKEVYFRTHTDYFHDLVVLEVEEGMERKSYPVTADVFNAMSEEPTFKSKRYFLYATQGGSYGLWGVSLPMDNSGDINSWSESALAVIERAKSEWVRHYAKRGDSGYRLIPASKNLGDPVWPPESWEELLELAFKDKIINDLNHPVLQKLRGEL